MRKQPEKRVWLDVKNLYEQVGCAVYNLSQARAAKQTPGFPDFWIVLDRKRTAWWHELKTPKGTPNDAQERFHARCHSCNIVCLVGGVDVAIAHLRTLGVWKDAA